MAAVAYILHVLAAFICIFEFLRYRRPECPADSCPYVMGYGLVRRCAHVAGRACRGSSVVFSYDPGIIVHIQPFLVGFVENAVLRFLIDLDLRMVGTEMAFAAGLWLPRLGL